MAFEYEELRQYLRNWVNPCNEIGQYDAVGLIHLLIAIIDNLRENESCGVLVDLSGLLDTAQHDFVLRLASALRQDADK